MPHNNATRYTSVKNIKHIPELYMEVLTMMDSGPVGTLIFGTDVSPGHKKCII